MRANQLRLWFASMPYALLCALRRIGLSHTRLADVSCGTIRLKLLKIGTLVRVSVRRINFAMASSCPDGRYLGQRCRPPRRRRARPHLLRLTRICRYA
jgi:Transposase DDE domain group 1